MLSFPAIEQSETVFAENKCMNKFNSKVYKNNKVDKRAYKKFSKAF